MVAVATAALLAALLGSGLLLGWFGLPGSRISTHPFPGPEPGPNLEAFFSLEGRLPQAFPETRLAIGFLTLDDPSRKAGDVLGPPDSTEPDILGTAYTWALPGGSSLLVSIWDDTQQVNGVRAFAPTESPVRFSAFGGVVVGSSTLRQVVVAWGAGYVAASHPEDDFAVSYVECLGPYPVIIKFDQLARTGDDYMPVPGSPLWNMPVTTLLVAYADEPPGASGCSTLPTSADARFPVAYRAAR